MNKYTFTSLSVPATITIQASSEVLARLLLASLVTRADMWYAASWTPKPQ